MRLEIAQELGLNGAKEGYLGEVTCVQCGRYGHLLYTRAKQLLQSSSPAGPTKSRQSVRQNTSRSALKRGAGNPPGDAEVFAEGAENLARADKRTSPPKNRRPRGTSKPSRRSSEQAKKAES